MAARLPSRAFAGWMQDIWHVSYPEAEPMASISVVGRGGFFLRDENSLPTH